MQPRNCPLLLPWPVTFKKNGHQIRNGDRAPISGHAANSVFRFDRRLNYVATPMPPDWIANQPENSMIDFFQRSLRLPSFFFFLSFFLHFVSRRGWAIADYRRFKAETRVDLCGKQIYIYIKPYSFRGYSIGNRYWRYLKFIMRINSLPYLFRILSS